MSVQHATGAQVMLTDITLVIFAPAAAAADAKKAAGPTDVLHTWILACIQELLVENSQQTHIMVRG
jgi:hypothetical protein